MIEIAGWLGILIRSGIAVDVLLARNLSLFMGYVGVFLLVIARRFAFSYRPLVGGRRDADDLVWGDCNGWLLNVGDAPRGGRGDERRHDVFSAGDLLYWLDARTSRDDTI